MVVNLTDPITSENAVRLGEGMYLVQSPSVGSFSIGRRRTMMTVITTAAGDRFYLKGPFYFDNIVGVSISQLPDGVFISEGQIPSFTGVITGDGDKNPPPAS